MLWEEAIAWLHLVQVVNPPPGPESVVGVHEGVNHKVHDDEPPRRGRVLGEGVPAVY